MTYSVPTHGEPNWDGKINPSLQYLKDTAEAAETPTGAQAKATAAQNAAISAAATDATNKANAAQANAISTAASDATTKANSVQSNLNIHIGNVANPHSVTKAQVGLGNVDNTSDANKPISTAQQTALDAKQSAAALDTDVAAKVNDSASSTRAALDDAAISRTARTKHATALGLYFPEAEGAVWDGSADDTAAIQATVTACPEGASVVLQAGNGRITSPISVSKGIRIVGSGAGQYTSRIVAYGCNGIEVSAGVVGFALEGVEIACGVRYTTTANILIGVKLAGTSTSKVTNCLLRDVYLDGFKTAVWGNCLWSSTFRTVTTNYGLIGLDVYGSSVNNFVYGGCRFVVSTVAGSRGIRLTGNDGSSGGAATGIEGWVISDSLVYGGEIGIELVGAAHIYIHDCIVDYNQVYGVRISDNGTNFGGNCDIHDNYIAMGASSGQAAINVANAVSSSQYRTNRIHANDILVYNGQSCQYGIYGSGANSGSDIYGNTILGFGVADIRLQSAGYKVHDNTCLTAAPSSTANIYTTYLNEIYGNTGVVYLLGGSTPNSFVRKGRLKETYTNAAPTTGTWAVGDRSVNYAPAVGSPKGWVCTVAGTPGTWVSEGNL